jgi:hypothetical protein
MLKDGSNAAGTACTGISIGLGFVGKKVANPTKIDNSDAAAPPDPCTTSPDAGNPDTGTGTETSVPDTGTGG